MKNSKLIEILSALSKEEFIQFRKMLQSPFFVTSSIPLQLYDYLRKYYPKFESTKLSKERVFQKILPNRPYNDAKMRAMILRLTQLAENFLVWQQVRNHSFQKNLVNAFGDRSLFSLYQKEHKSLLTKLETGPSRGFSHYEEIFALHRDFYYHPQRQKLDPSEETFQRMLDNLDKHFIISKLRLAADALNQERIFGKRYQLRFIDAIRSELRINRDNVLFQLYDQLFELFSTGEVEDFVHLENTFFENVNQLQTEDAQLIYFYSLNYLNRKVNEGEAAFSPRAFHWYEFGLRENLLLQNGKITEASFGNVVIYGCREKAFDWTFSFLQSYRSQINTENTEDVFQFNLALWHFYKGELEEAFTVLSGFGFHPSFQLKVRLTSLRILFEQFMSSSDYFDAVRSYANSSLKFIRRTDAYSKAVLLPAKNTIEVIKALSLKVWNREKNQDIQKWLEKKLDKTTVLARSWLLTQIK